MTKAAFALLALLIVFCAPTKATEPFGTKAEAVAIADQLLDILNTQGLSAGVSALFNPELPFSSTRMGINLLKGTFIVGDNREPETVSADYAQTADLTGRLAWPLIDEAATEGRDIVLKWYHYDTQEAYDFRCYCKRAVDPNVTVMVCR